MTTAKEQAIDSISPLPSTVTWQDIIHCLHVKQKIEDGIKAAEEGRVISHEEVKKLFRDEGKDGDIKEQIPYSVYAERRGG